MRWLLIDQFSEIRKGESAKGYRCITRSEGALTDDFPAFPVMPQSLLCEMMAQVGGVLAGATIDFSKEVVLAKISEAVFYKDVTPPAFLEIRARLADLGEDAAVTECEISDRGEPVAKGNVFFGLFTQLDGDGKGSIVFSKGFMESFAIRQSTKEGKTVS